MADDPQLWERARSGDDEAFGDLYERHARVREGGFGRRFIFDPRTSEILAAAEMIFSSRADGYHGVPDRTVFRETAYLRSGIVSSTRERP